jgi:hypothetical protein
VVALLVVAALTFIDIGGDGDGGRGGKRTQVVSAGLKLQTGGTKAENAGVPVELPGEIPTELLKIVGTYVDEGLVQPLLTGSQIDLKKVRPLFDAAAGETATGRDRATVFEEGLGEVAIDRAEPAPVFFTGLSDASGTFVLVTAGFNLVLGGEGADGKVAIERSHELAFVQQDGAWKITGYDLVVVRDAPGLGATTTTRAKS